MERESITVFNPLVARKLLHLGYHIIDIKPSKIYKTSSIFVFKNEDGLLESMIEISKTINKK